MNKPGKNLAGAAAAEAATDKQAAQKPSNARRNFLIGASVGSVGAAAALVASGAAVPTAKEATPQVEPEGKGYRETEHIRRYYGTTRI